jgi:hypothetical protein
MTVKRLIMSVDRFLPLVEMTAESRSMGERGAATSTIALKPKPPLSHPHVNDGTSFRPKGEISFLYSHVISTFAVLQIVRATNDVFINTHENQRFKSPPLYPIGVSLPQGEYKSLLPSAVKSSAFSSLQRWNTKYLRFFSHSNPLLVGQIGILMLSLQVSDGITYW